MSLSELFKERKDKRFWIKFDYDLEKKVALISMILETDLTKYVKSCTRVMTEEIIAEMFNTPQKYEEFNKWLNLFKDVGDDHLKREATIRSSLDQDIVNRFKKKELRAST